MKTNAELTVRCNSSPEFIDRHLNDNAYQILQIVSGTGFVFLGTHLSFLSSGDLVFMKPGSSLIWSLSGKATLHYCKVSTKYFEKYPHVARLFDQDKIFNLKMIISNPPQGQASAIGMLFKMIRQEMEGLHEDKKEAILIHLQLLLLLAHRIN
ncbi:hypothetical protein [Chitinophaga silvisoli]|uniref:AraC-type arabinose-binding/dimerisation domain-containing protein n=1 Tax=Chitinophaga silvisoli TaxID=2291814 RepID=A0A3E1NUA7_9BACT|nr:hypothetical protein [Chitinophaga silvisoli]RFM31529.1 hypothetical protein DXN04_27825 [Chitinophaga silvisoli]